MSGILLFTLFFEFRFTFNSVFTTWQAVYLDTQNVFLLVGSIGLIDIPTEDEIKSLMAKIKAAPQEYRLTA